MSGQLPPKNPPPSWYEGRIEDLKRQMAEEKVRRSIVKLFALLFFAFFLVDTFVYLRGHNTFFWSYKTPNELEYQRKIFGLDDANR